MTDTSEAPYAPGAVVVLASDGGKMTVVKCLPTTELADSHKYPSQWAVHVRWVQEDGTFHDRMFDAALVKLYRSQWEIMQDGMKLALARDEGERLRT